MNVIVVADLSLPCRALPGHVADLEREFELDIDWWLCEPPPAAPTGRRRERTERALELAVLALDRGRFADVFGALVRARFEDGDDIADGDVLARIASGCGLDPEEVRFERLIGRYTSVVEEHTSRARARGYSETPTVVVDDRAVIQGAQSYDAYADALLSLGARLRHPGII